MAAPGYYARLTANHTVTPLTLCPVKCSISTGDEILSSAIHILRCGQCGPQADGNLQRTIFQLEGVATKTLAQTLCNGIQLILTLYQH